MAGKRRKFKREPGRWQYRKFIIIATEGDRTEKQYFDIFKNSNAVIKLECLRSKDRSSPKQVLERMQHYLRREGLDKNDKKWQAWLVLDCDQNSEDTLQELYQWTQSNEHYHLAVSNPQFEYWLLLHFENGKKISNGKECVRRLRYYCPNYTKNDIQPHKYEKGIDKAIRRAREKDSPPCKSWPRQNGSTVYLLVEELRGS